MPRTFSASLRPNNSRNALGRYVVTTPRRAWRRDHVLAEINFARFVSEILDVQDAAAEDLIAELDTYLETIR